MRLPAAALMLCAGSASAQMPDVMIRLDLTLNYRQAEGEEPTLRWYDSLGRHSVVALAFTLEPGFKAFVSQKLQRIANDGDPEQLDEYFVEDEGNWRVGKQYLPFGSGRILRESVMAARSDTQIIIEDLPIQVAICDAGPGRQRGVVARLGTRLGASLAYGAHFGIAGTALTYVRRPEASPGKGRGWSKAIGIDYSKTHGTATFRLEWVGLRDPDADGDEDQDIIDLSVSLDPSRYRSVTAGLTREMRAGSTFLRLGASFLTAAGVWLEPLVRYRDGKFYDLSLAVRVRL